MGSTKQVRRLNRRLAAQIDLLDQSEPRREEIHQKMLRLPEGKAPKSLLQAEIGAFGSVKDSTISHDGYGRSITNHKRRA